MNERESELVRKVAVQMINADVESMDENSGRKRLESKYGKVWDTQELQKAFSVQGFMAPFVVVTRKSDNKKGSLEFQHLPRFYFNFQEI
jgi:hypothetical protein